MRTMIYIAITVACLFGATSAQAQKQNDKNKVEFNNVGNFASLRIDAVGTIYFTQGEQCTVSVEGAQAEIEKVRVEVKEGTLRIKYKDGKGKNAKKLTYYIQAPTLQKLDFNGVGSFRCEQPLQIEGDVELKMDGVGNIYVKEINCKDLKLNFDGVGNVDVNLNCKNLTADADGVGSVKLRGSAASGRVSKDGVGSMNTKQLTIGNK